MKKLLTLLLATGLHYSYAQLTAGVGFGTFNNPGSEIKFRGWGPTLMLEYSNVEEVEYYLNVSFYKKTIDSYSQSVYDENGFLVGLASVAETYQFKYLQLGFKRSLAGDFSDTRFNFFAGAGGALGFVNSQFNYNIPGNEAITEKTNYLIYGLHFNAGMQWRLKPLTLELKGNLDFSGKPILPRNGNEYIGAFIFTSTRLGILVPITK